MPAPMMIPTPPAVTSTRPSTRRSDGVGSTLRNAAINRVYCRASLVRRASAHHRTVLHHDLAHRLHHLAAHLEHVGHHGWIHLHRRIHFGIGTHARRRPGHHVTAHVHHGHGGGFPR